MKLLPQRGWLIPIVVFVALFLAGPLYQLKALSLMPGGIGDARLNNYFLENIYLFFVGQSESLWHLPFFWPFPFVGGFSDNLFGSAPIYVLFRALGTDSFTAFQLWFLAGYALNFVSCYYGLRLLKLSPLGATVGAAIFTFSLPVSSRWAHAQLHYRFAVPISAALLLRGLDHKSWRDIGAAAAFLVWQFYCSIYIGFFALMLLIFLFIGWIAKPLLHTFKTRNINSACLELLKIMPGWPSARCIAGFFVLAGGIGLLFYPYAAVTALYGFTRSPDEINMMLPRLYSYLLSDVSWFWRPENKLFDSLPMRHEHGMFFGVVPILLALAGIYYSLRLPHRAVSATMAFGLAAMFLSTLSVGSVSFWHLVSSLPLVSAIRAVARFDLIMIFPVAYFAGVGATCLAKQFKGRSGIVVAAALICAIIVESSAINPATSPKSLWQTRLQHKKTMLPENIRTCSVLFFAQTSNEEGLSGHLNVMNGLVDELDAMWVARELNMPTLNGYSGNLPPDFRLSFGQDLNELPRRVLSWIGFNSDTTASDEKYHDMLKNVLVVGFEEEPHIKSWYVDKPARSDVREAYQPHDLSWLSIEPLGKLRRNGRVYLVIAIHNKGENDIASRSLSSNPLRVAWRFLDRRALPLTDWNDTRKDIPFDIPAGGSVQLELPLHDKAEITSSIVEISIVQEGAFWLHDHGLIPSRFSLHGNDH